MHFLIDDRRCRVGAAPGVALFRFWEQRDHLSEGRETLARVLAMPGAGPPTRLRARALYCASCWPTSRASRGGRALSHAACRDLPASSATAGPRDDDGGHGLPGAAAGPPRRGDRRGSARRWRSGSELGDAVAVDLGTSNMANAARAGGNFELARRLFEEVVESSRARGDQRGVASALNGLGDVAAAQGHYDSARLYHHDSLARFREIDHRWGIGAGARRSRQRRPTGRRICRRRPIDHGGAAGFPRARPPARRRPPARVAGLVRQLPVEGRGAGQAGERGSGDPPRIGGAGQAERKGHGGAHAGPGEQRLTLEAFADAWKRRADPAPLDRLLGDGGGGGSAFSRGPAAV